MGRPRAVIRRRTGKNTRNCDDGFFSDRLWRIWYSTRVY